MTPQPDVAERLTNFYRDMDQTVPELAPSWRLESERRRRRPSWPIQVLATAALVALAVGAGLLIREARLNPSPAPVTSPSPRAGSPPIVTLGNWVRPMGLLSNRDGWVLSGNTLSLTHDGGITWRVVTPPTYSCCAVYFLDEANGWAAGAYGPGSHVSQSLEIFRTINGGARWKQLAFSSPPSVTCCPALDFVDPQDGWLIYQDNLASGAPIGRLLRTTDGGASWTDLPTLPAVPVELHGIFQNTQLHFVSSSTGWFVGDNGYAGTQHLYVSHDGGQSWQPQAVPVPPWEAQVTLHLTVPSFLGDKEGVLPITLEDGHVLLDSTTDGGATWNIGTPLFSRNGPQAAIQGNEAPTFIGNGVTAVAAGRELDFNSGSGWTSIRPAGIHGVIYFVEFADARVGWALTGQGQCPQQPCASRQVVLMRTTDGGHSWSRVGDSAVSGSDSAALARLPIGASVLVLLGALALVGFIFLRTRSQAIRLRSEPMADHDDDWR